MTKISTLLSLTAAFGMAAAGSIAAQGGQSDRADQKVVTVTGCLDRDTSTPSTTKGTTPAGTSGAERFVLIKAHTAAADATSGGYTTNRTGSPWYVVVGDAAQLRHDARHVVEVKGTLDDLNEGQMNPTAHSVPPEGTLHVTSLKVLSGSCGE